MMETSLFWVIQTCHARFLFGVEGGEMLFGWVFPQVVCVLNKLLQAV